MKMIAQVITALAIIWGSPWLLYALWMALGGN